MLGWCVPLDVPPGAGFLSTDGQEMVVKLEKPLAIPNWALAVVGTILTTGLLAVVGVGGWAGAQIYQQNADIQTLKSEVASLRQWIANQPPSPTYQQYVDQRFDAIERSIESVDKKLDKVLEKKD